MQYDVKELNLGGILDQAIALTRNHMGLFLGVASLSLGYSLVTGLIQVATMPPVSPTATFQEQIAAMNEANVQLIRWLPLFLLAALAVASLTNAALVVAITKKYLGEPVTAGESLKQALGRFWADSCSLSSRFLSC